MKRFTASVAASLVLALGLSTAKAQQTLYWDVNGIAPGGANAGIGDGAWDLTTANWNLVPDGTGTPVNYVEGDHVIFAAGNDLGTDPTTAGLFFNPAPGSHSPGSVVFEEGWVDLTGAVLAMGANPITVKTGATLSFPNQTNITATAGQTLTLDGGTIRNYVQGAGSTFYTAATATKWLVTANGGTINTPNGGVVAGKTVDAGPNVGYSIMAYGNATNALSTIGLDPSTTVGTLHKTGSGEFRPFNSTNIPAWDVQLGLLRAPSGSNDGAFGAATGTITVAGGAVPNTTSGAAVGTTANLTADVGGAGPSPATRSWVLSGSGATPDSIFVLNANWQILGNIGGPGALMLNGWARTDGGPATGSSVIGAQNTELRLGGANTYGGATTINFGTLVAQGGSAIPNNSRVAFSTQSVWGGPTPALQLTLDTAVLRVEATETVGSLSGGNASRGQVTISGPAVTLTTGNDDTTSTFSGTITGTGGLAKVGSGTFTMDGVKSYTGDTKVTGGTLSTNSASLGDLADVYIAGTSIFNLNFAGNDTIDSLFFNGVAQAIGTWGAAGSGATNISSFFTGTGVLQVSSIPGPVGVPGDYNNNGVVDSADYVVWRNGGPLQNEVAGVTPGSVTPEDYTAWKARFGNTSGSGSSLAGGAAVPEPCGLVLLLAGAAAIIARRHRLSPGCPRD